ncbi:Imm63 family immunity protein [Propionispira raffinosivorans]|uniref:Imm63 family immunity protein n=1 Tax=Propionispira raffinosivorans TaxID=86959 RepID=UPI00036EDBB9|nr:Imm63 family immunity protein [Propionispira raffinosivorans]
MSILGLLNTEELRDNILEKYCKLKETSEKDGIYMDLNVYFAKGTPNNREGTFVFADNYGYHFVYTERGEIQRHQITYDLFEISYWIFEDMIFMMASKFELKNRIENQDFRRILFAKEVELFNAIGVNFKKRCEIAIDEILKLAPYDDNL